MDWLYELGWWAPGALGLAGLSLALRWGRKTQQRAGLGLLALAIVLGLTSFLVDSDREQVVRRTRQLAAAIEKRDWETLKPLVHAHVSMLWVNGREQFIETARRGTEASELKTLRVSSLDTQPPRGGYCEVTAQFAGQFERFGAGYARFKLEWEKTPEGWQVSKVVFLDSPFIDESRFGRGLPQ